MAHPNFIYPEDRFIDPIDNTIRTVWYVEGNSVYTTDGGVVGADEIKNVYLPFEDITLARFQEDYDNGYTSEIDF